MLDIVIEKHSLKLALGALYSMQICTLLRGRACLLDWVVEESEVLNVLKFSKFSVVWLTDANEKPRRAVGRFCRPEGSTETAEASDYKYVAFSIHTEAWLVDVQEDGRHIAGTLVIQARLGQPKMVSI
jgi:hypothetical protein